MSQMLVNPVKCSVKNPCSSGTNDFSSVYRYRMLCPIEAA